MNLVPASIDPAIVSLLSFWADAGVDVACADEPVDRLAEGRRRLEAPAQKAVATVAPHLAQTRANFGHGPQPAAAAAASAEFAAHATTLEALSAAITQFEGCPLKGMGARQAVFARGRPDARIMLIGEGPGADEDLQGSPFVGRAGKLLDRMLAAAGLTDQVFITNTVFWRPPGNRTPSVEEQATCAPFLNRTISLVDPDYLVLLGGASAKSMLARTEGILTLRGRWNEWTGPDGKTRMALPTLHPAFLLRQPAAKKQAWSDWLTLTARLERDGRKL